MNQWRRRDWLRLIGAGTWAWRAAGLQAAPPSCAWAPRYPSAPPLEALFPLIDPARDVFPEEKHAFRVEAFFARWRGEPLLAKPPGSGAPDLREFRVTRIEVRAEAPLLLRCRVRFEIARRTPENPWVRLGEAEVDMAEGDGALHFTAARVLHSRDATAPRLLYGEVTGSVFANCLSFQSQLAVGTDEWRRTLDGASGIDVYGNCGLAVGDGELYVCQPAGLPNRLYRFGEDGRCEDVTEQAGVGVLDHTASALFADFDNRGVQDLLVVCSNGPLLFRNDGRGRYTHVPGAFPFAAPPQGTFTGAAAADFDGDGKLDVYFCVYSYYQGLDQYRFPLPYHDARNGPPNFLFRNAGAGKFADVTAASGLGRNNDRFSFAASWSDIDGSGRPSLYVVNDFGRNNLYRNNGDGTFTDIAAAAGVEDVGAGMSAAWADWSGSGRQDLYVANMWTAEGLRLTGAESFPSSMSAAGRRHFRKHAMGNSYFRNEGQGRFTDATAATGTGFGRWAWASDAVGQDLFVTNGMITGDIGVELNSFFWRQVVGQSPETAVRAPAYERGWAALNERIRTGDSWSGAERNVYYRNRGNGAFEDVSALSGIDFAGDSRAFALADLDGDGRPEIIVKNRTAPQVQVFANTGEGSFLAVRLRGTTGNRDAIGALVTVEGAFAQEVRAGSGFLSQHSRELFFPLAERAGTVSVHVRWPGGALQNFRDVPVNRRIELVEGRGTFTKRPVRAPLPPALSGAAVPRPDSFWLLAPVDALPLAGYAFPDVPSLLVIAGEGCAPPPSGIREKRVLPEAALEYSVLYRYLRDERRDLPVPCAFLLDPGRQIRKVYPRAWTAAEVRADVARLGESPASLALPFAGRYYFREAAERNHFTLGVAFYSRGLLPAAAAAFEAVLRRTPEYPEAHYNLGSVYLAERRRAEAGRQFAEAVRLRPEYAEAWNNLGVIAAEEGNASEAERCWRECLRLQPANALGHLNLGTLYRQTGRAEEAQRLLTEAARLDPADGEVPYQLGMLAAQSGRLAEAEAFLRESLRLRPHGGETLNNLAILLLQQARAGEALPLLEEAVAHAPDFDQPYLNLARLHVQAGRREAAQATLENLLRRQPGHQQGQAMLRQLRNP